jgi:hypothetical protein
MGGIYPGGGFPGQYSLNGGAPFSPAAEADIVIMVRPDPGVIDVRSDVGVIDVRPDPGDVEL